MTNTLSSSFCYSFVYLFGLLVDRGEYEDSIAWQCLLPKYRKMVAGQWTGLTMIACSRPLYTRLEVFVLSSSSRYALTPDLGPLGPKIPCCYFPVPLSIIPYWFVQGPIFVPQMKKLATCSVY